MVKKMNLDKEKENLNVLAHEGSLESIEKIEKIMAESDNEELIDYAGYALDEARYLYYAPNNEQEENDLILLKSIVEKEDNLFELDYLGGGFEYELKKLNIEKEVDKEVTAKLDAEMISEDDEYEKWLLDQIEQIDTECVYWEEWIRVAEQTISVEKYREMPRELVKKIYLDGEDNLENLESEEEMCDDQEWCDCDEECDCGC